MPNLNLKTELAYYDIYPKVVQAETETQITIAALGTHVHFMDGENYAIEIIPLCATNANVNGGCYEKITVQAEKSRIVFQYSFSGEQQYTLRIFNPDGTDRVTLSVYALLPDLFQLRPYRGDLHSHTHYSDGHESPAFIAAQYRKDGYDFLAVTDHYLYHPSTEAIETYQDTEIDLLLFPGEEIHPPDNNSHIINFGGSSSVNKRIKDDPAQYYREVEALSKELDVPEGVNAAEYASCVWCYRHIQSSGGLAILPHTHWVDNRAYHVRDAMVWHLFETKPFDALEVVGGNNIHDNIMQTAIYQQAREQGFRFPVVGSSDSHGVINSEWYKTAQTIVLAGEKTHEGIKAAVKSGLSVALEQYAAEAFPRIYGDYRLVSYILFLLSDYFPLHDDLCYEEGRQMRDYSNGISGAAESLKAMKGRTLRILDKYWAG